MSLRTQIHSAFDEVAPATHGLPERIVQTVMTENATRYRKEGLMLRLRVPLALVAVFMVVALVVGVLIGGRLIHDWNALNNSAPAGGSDQSQVAQLEAMPLHLPVFASRADCKSGPFNYINSLGSGPVYFDGGTSTTTNWGTYFHIVAYADTTIAGPILVRARDLFTGQPVVFVGLYASGPVIGSDIVDGKSYAQHTEMLLNARTSDNQAVSHKLVWLSISGESTTGSIATAWQVDGVGFSEVFVAC